MVKTQIRCAAASDTGRVRRNNEDAFYVNPDTGVFLVVDGIGGQAAGEKAAELARETVRARLERRTGTAEQRLREAIAVANNQILHAARDNAEWRGMACVLTAAVVEDGTAVVGHVGDSRLYHIRGGTIRKITHDHSPVGVREDNQEIGEAEAMRHPRRNEIFRDVGSEEHSPDDPGFVEIIRTPFEPDAALVLCSDGLSDQVPSGEIRAAVERHAGDPEAAVRELIDAANRAGGKDNVTVVVVEGEHFAAPRALPQSTARGAGWPAYALWFLCGAAVVLAGAWFSRGVWAPQPAPFAPRVLSAGAGQQFATITEALAAARAGDTVEVAGGEYREQIRLKNGVSLRSRPPREAILRAPAVGSGPAVLAEGVHGARLTGFRILGSPEMPLAVAVVLHDSVVEVDDNEIAGAGTAIEVRGGAAPELRANLVHDCTGEGILIIGPSQPWISHNNIQRTKGAGVAARDGAHPLLAGNVLEKNALELPAESVRALAEHNTLLDGPTARRPSPRGKKE